MDTELIEIIQQLNPWLIDKNTPISPENTYIQRFQTEKLLLAEWDKLWLVLIGPRQAGKTTLGKYLSQQLLNEQRFEQLLYLNCDHNQIRQWLHSPLFLNEAVKKFNLKKPIIFIDEVQRIENPGLLLKAIADLQLPIKMIASGSSQLELKSKVQEYLTGRQLESLILPLSYREIGKIDSTTLVYGCYPNVITSTEKEIILNQLYNEYINKDIIEILQIGQPDLIRKLITLVAHSSGQLINYNQLAVDCRSTIPTIQKYLSLLEQTYVIKAVKPFVGNKRKEITANPKYYFLDNGFRNQALRNFSMNKNRVDIGLLVESAIFQEIFKYQTQEFLDFDIHFWRTRSGAEVDFILYKNEDNFLPIEAKYQKMTQPKISRSFRSFITAYQPKAGIFITKDYNAKIDIDNCKVYFIPLSKIMSTLPIIKQYLGLN